MAVFETTVKIRGENVSFTRNPFPGRSTYSKGWLIMAYETTGDLYGGSYIRNVGFADKVETGFICFRLKRDAVAAIRDAISLGILTRDPREE